MPIQNSIMQSYRFLEEMAKDQYFPSHLVEEGKQILCQLCERIETEHPKDLGDLYTLTHAAAEQFNDLQTKFENGGSEIETMARDCIGHDFANVAQAYGFTDADTEELIATREW